LNEEEEVELLSLIIQHQDRTRSTRAAAMLQAWPAFVVRFRAVRPSQALVPQPAETTATVEPHESTMTETSATESLTD
ncbi:MAG TPA: hypothetical protein VJ816_03495, partial [Gemmatimonadales bacterium]|nr:hypothetical protein [Gemmatimonadales bacterium]